MKSSHVRFSDFEHSWIKLVADAERRSVTSLIELFVMNKLQESYSHIKPAHSFMPDAPKVDNLFDGD
jgi:hypothetical protein